MAKKITVRTVRATPKVQMAPDAAGGPAPAEKKPGLSMAPSAMGPGQGVVPERLQNPFDNTMQAQLATKPENYTWQAILTLLATMMILGIIGIQWFEWDLYTGGFTPVFLRTQPVMGAPMLPPAAVRTPTEAPPADDMTDDEALPE